MKIKIRDRNGELIHELSKYNLQRYNVDIYHGDIFIDDNFDALVSPANSFGFMNGGIDGVYVAKYGQQLEDKVKNEINVCCRFNELLVGDALLVNIDEPPTETGESKQWLIIAPTMRVPMPIPAINVFLATRAAIGVAVSMRFEEIVMPGMGTGVGNVPFDQAARAMVIGIEQGLYGPEKYSSCAQAYLDHNKFDF